MSKSRRQFLAHAPLALLGAAVASYAQDQKPPELPPGAPPAFGTAPAVGPEVSPTTFADAEKLVQVEFTSDELAQAAGKCRSAMAPVYERRVGPHKVALEPTLAPWSRWDPVLPGQQQLPARSEFVRSKTDPGPLPSRDEDIAFATVTQLSRWIEARQLSSERLTLIYLARLARFDPKLRCVITPTRSWRCTRRCKPTRKSPPANIAGHCTAFRGVPRICSTLPAFELHMAPSPSATEYPEERRCRATTRTRPERFWWPS